MDISKVHEVIVLDSIHGEYRDDFGNVVYGECENCKIIFHGSDNNFDFRGADITGSEIHIGSKCSIKLCENVCFVNNKVFLQTGWDIKINIGKYVDCSSGKIIMFAGSELVIGEGTTV